MQAAAALGTALVPLEEIGRTSLLESDHRGPPDADPGEHLSQRHVPRGTRRGTFSLWGTKKGPGREGPDPLLNGGSGGRIRTYDLRVMSPTSCQTAPPRAVSGGHCRHLGLTCKGWMRNLVEILFCGRFFAASSQACNGHPNRPATQFLPESWPESTFVWSDGLARSGSPPVSAASEGLACLTGGSAAVSESERLRSRSSPSA